jgi:hypothetical protein
MVTVSGFPKDIPYQRCVRCIADCTVPGISFDEKGECSLCKMHDRWEKIFPNDERGAKILEEKFEKIRREGKGKKYDCIVGISGGRDSTYLLYLGTDVGIGASLYGVAYKEGVKNILFGQSFRTEGVRPIAWAYFDGDHLRAVHKKFGTYPLREWNPRNPGYNLGIREMFFYSVLQGIRVFSPLYYYPYIRNEAGSILEKELEWVYPGAHYFDDLYWSLITYIHRTKFNIDFRLIEYSALIRSGLLGRDEALEKVKKIYQIEDPKVISLCLKRLGVSQEDFDAWMKLPPKHWWDYPNSYSLMRRSRLFIRAMTRLGIFTPIVYDKYFKLKFGYPGEMTAHVREGGLVLSL